MQDRFRPAARIAAAGVLAVSAGCTAGTPPSTLPNPTPSRTVPTATAAAGTVRPASFQDEENRGEFFDPLLDAPADAPGAPADDDSARSETSELGAGPPTIEFEAAVALAVARSPRAEAARQRAAAVAARFPQVTALDDPTLSSTSYPLRDQALQTAAGRVQTGVQVAQRVPWPNKLNARGEAVRREVQIARTEVASAELAAAQSARIAWFEAWYAGRATEVTRRNRALLEQLSEVAVARVRTGGAQTDVLRAELEIDRLDDRLLGLRRAEDVARADLAAALRLPPGAPLPTAAAELPALDPSTEVDSLFAAAQSCRPELRRIGWEIARDRTRRRLACLAAKPDFTAGLGYGVVTEEDALAGNANGRDNLSVQIGLTLPIYQDKIRAGVAEADRRLAADARSLDAERDDTLRAIRRLAIRLETLEDQLALLEDRTLPRAERTLDVSLADYRGDRIGFTEVANSYGDLLRLEVQRARLRADVGVALAELERTVGCGTDAFTQSQISVQPEPLPAPMPQAQSEAPAIPDPPPSAANEPTRIPSEDEVKPLAGWRKATPRRP